MRLRRLRVQGLTTPRVEAHSQSRLPPPPGLVLAQFASRWCGRINSNLATNQSARGLFLIAPRSCTLSPYHPIARKHRWLSGLSLDIPPWRVRLPQMHLWRPQGLRNALTSIPQFLGSPRSIFWHGHAWSQCAPVDACVFPLERIFWHGDARYHRAPVDAVVFPLGSTQKYTQLFSRLVGCLAALAGCDLAPYAALSPLARGRLRTLLEQVSRPGSSRYSRPGAHQAGAVEQRYTTRPRWSLAFRAPRVMCMPLSLEHL